MTLLDERPLALDETSAPGSVRRRRAALGGWRFAARLARREVQRRPGRTLLVVLLVAVPVLAMTVASVLFRTNDDDHEARFARQYGGADLVAQTYDTRVSAEVLASGLPAGSRTTTVVEASYLGFRTDGGRRALAIFVQLDPADPLTVGIAEVTTGRLPGPGEALVSAGLAERLQLAVGDRFVVDAFGLDAELVGIGRLARDHRSPLVIAPDLDLGRFRNQGSTSLLVDLPAAADPALVREDVTNAAFTTGDPFSGSVFTRTEGGFDTGTAADRWRAMVFGWIAGALLLAVLGIIVAAAFAVSARRQLVNIGLLAANGADGAVVRRVLALQGAWSGAAGAVVGVAGGVLGVGLARGFVESTLAHRLDAYVYDASDLLLIALTGTVAAAVAAFVPARAISRVPTLAALGGRRPLGRVPGRLVPVGLALFGLGVVLLVLVAQAATASDGGGSEEFLALIGILGGIGVLVGACCASPLVIGALGPVGERIGGIGRLAARSLARGRTRSAAIVSAIAVAGAAALVLSAAFASNAAADDRNSPSSTTTVTRDGTTVAGPPPPSRGFATVSQWQNYGTIADVVRITPPPALDRTIVADLSAAIPELTWSTLRVAFYEPDPTTLTPDEYVDPQLPVGDAVLQDLLALTTDERARLEEVGALWIWGAPVADETGVDDETGEAAGGGTGATDLPAVDVVRFQTTDGPIEIEVAVGEPDRRTGAVDVPVFGPGFMISEATAAELGLPLIDAAAVGLLPGPMTVEQQDRLVDAFPVTYFPGPTTPDTGMSWATGVNWSYVDPGTTGFSAERLQLIVSLVAIGFVLLVVAIGLALAATESKDERDVLLAIGARPASLRRVAATKASLLAVAGAAIALPTGLLPFWAVWRSSVTTQVYVAASEQWEEAAAPIALPWLTIAALVLVIPAVVGLGAWLASTVAHGVRPVRMSTLAED